MQTASPGQLVLMLYEGAIRFLEQALQGFAKEDLAESNEAIHNNLLRAQQIIHELNVSLNMKEGGEFADCMRSLYQYMDRRLMEANLNKSKVGIEEVIRRLGTLRDAWSAMLQGKSTDEAAQQPQLVAA